MLQLRRHRDVLLFYLMLWYLATMTKTYKIKFCPRKLNKYRLVPMPFFRVSGQTVRQIHAEDHTLYTQWGGQVKKNYESDENSDWNIPDCGRCLDSAWCFNVCRSCRANPRPRIMIVLGANRREARDSRHVWPSKPRVNSFQQHRLASLPMSIPYHLATLAHRKKN